MPPCLPDPTWRVVGSSHPHHCRRCFPSMRTLFRRAPARFPLSSALQSRQPTNRCQGFKRWSRLWKWDRQCRTERPSSHNCFRTILVALGGTPCFSLHSVRQLYICPKPWRCSCLLAVSMPLSARTQVPCRPRRQLVRISHSPKWRRRPWPPSSNFNTKVLSAGILLVHPFLRLFIRALPVHRLQKRRSDQNVVDACSDHHAPLPIHQVLRIVA